MKKTTTLTITPILVLLLCSACGVSKHQLSTNPTENAVTTTAPDGISRILAADSGTSDDVESSTLNSSDDTQEALETADETNNATTRKAKLREIDKKFMDKFKTLNTEQKKAVVKKIIKVLLSLKDMSEEDRKTAIKAIRPPLPSKKVLQKIVPKRKQESQE